MDILVEFLLELAFEGVYELSNNKKLNKWIRYPLVLIVSLCIITVIGGLFILGIVLISKNKFEQVIAGLFLILIAMLLLFSGIRTFRKNIKNK